MLSGVVDDESLRALLAAGVPSRATVLESRSYRATGNGTSEWQRLSRSSTPTVARIGSKPLRTSRRQFGSKEELACTESAGDVWPRRAEEAVSGLTDHPDDGVDLDGAQANRRPFILGC